MKTKGYVVRIDSERTHGWQYKRHGWAGICMNTDCRCHLVASRFFADKKHGGKRKAKQLALAMRRKR